MNGVYAGITVNDYCSKQYQWRAYTAQSQAALWSFVDIFSALDCSLILHSPLIKESEHHFGALPVDNICYLD